MAQDDHRKQDDGAIFDALAAVEGPIVREQPPEQERDWASFNAYAEEPTQAERRTLLDRAAGSLASDDGQDMTQELLDERRKEAKDKEW